MASPAQHGANAPGAQVCAPGPRDCKDIGVTRSLSTCGRGRQPIVGLALFCAVLLGSGSAHAQTPTGAILGWITDPSGGAVGGATVSVTHEATGGQCTVSSLWLGSYECLLLPPGRYRMEVSAPNFKTAVRTGVELEVEGRTRVDFRLEIGQVSEYVTVEASGAAVQVDRSAMGTLVDTRKIAGLPLDGRDFFQLASLVPGAQLPAEGSQNSTLGGAISINGAREQANNFLLDGVDNNDLYINQVVVPPALDSVREFKIQSASHSAEYGRSAGAQFNFVTKGGTNAWRGSLYGFLRDESLDAKNYFDDPDRAIPDFSRRQSGATVGGPLRRGRLFAFGSYENTSVDKAFTRVATVPPLAWRQGDFSSLLTGQTDPATGLDYGQLFNPYTSAPLPGNRIPDEYIDPAGAAILGFYPSPDDREATSPSGALVAPIGHDRLDQATLRLDYHHEASRLFARFSYWKTDRFNPFDPLMDQTNVPGFGTNNENLGLNFAIGWTRPIGARALNELRVGWNRLHARTFQEHMGNDVSSALGIRGLPTLPQQVGRPGIIVGITDSLIEPTNTPQDRSDDTLQITESVTWIQGSHTLKAGTEVRVFRSHSYLDTVARGRFVFVGISGNPIADLLLGLPYIAIRQNPNTDTLLDLRTTAFNAYVQDDWRPTSSLTINAGLRYEYNQPAYDTKNRFSVPDLTNPDGGFLPVGVDGMPRAGYESDANNFAPRVGVAWRPGASTRTVVRAAYGMFYDAPITAMCVNSRFNPPNYALDMVAGGVPLRDAFSGPQSRVPFAMGIDRHFRDPYYHSWSVGLERDLGHRLTVDVAYVGTRGRNLVVTLDPNQGPAGGPALRNPAFGPAQFTSSVGRSQYDAVLARLERRLDHGLTFMAAYTWSRSRDQSSSLWGSRASNYAPQNSFDLDAEWGPSDFDTPHRFVFSFVWELPFGAGRRHLSGKGPAEAILGGWTIAGIASYQSGRPFTVYYGPTVNYSGSDNGPGAIGLDRPNLVGDPAVDDPTPGQWFDVAAFAPPSGTFGNAGRNILRADALRNVDVALSKRVSVGARSRVELRIEAFNLFNTPHFYLPVADLTSVRAGQVVRAYDGRQIQIGARVTF